MDGFEWTSGMGLDRTESLSRQGAGTKPRGLWPIWRVFVGGLGAGVHGWGWFSQQLLSVWYMVHTVPHTLHTVHPSMHFD